MDERITTKHESYGKLRIHRTQGDADLFGVDYPTGHYMTLRIHECVHIRDLSGDLYHTDKPVIEISLSEIQWAQFISSPNTEGVACTIHYRCTEGFKKMAKPPARAMFDAEEFADEVRGKAEMATEKLADARKQLGAILSGHGPVRKGDLQRVAELLQTAQMQIDQNLPFVVEQAETAMNAAAERGKGEVEAYIGYAKQRLGEEALAYAARQTIEGSRDALTPLLPLMSKAVGDEG